jgi:spermidine synthase
VGAPADAGHGSWRFASAGGLSGFGCMAAELTAVRLLAPHFGDSAYVWTNVIGVILAALAIGAWWGGRLAARADAGGSAARLLVAAGSWTAAAPWFAAWIGGALLPAELPLDAAMPAMVRGSFVATAVLFGPPMLALGAVSPLLVTAAVRCGRDVGRAAGAIGAAGTLGSLAGTFVATHLLVPAFGCRIAMGLAGVALLVAAALPAWRTARVPAGVALLLAVGALFVPRGPLRPPPPGQQLVAEVESRVQFLQVLRDGPRTTLVINEGLDSFHSLAIEGSTFTAGAYYDWHALAPLLAGAAAPPHPLRALSVGDAAGTLRAVYAGVHPGATVDAVDVDRAAMVLGDEFFPGPKAAGVRAVVDGRAFVQRSARTWHVIHVDAYAHQVYVPAHLASREFFRACRERLEPGGVIACNVGALRPDDAVLRAIGATVAKEFGHARALLVPFSRNALLVARKGDPPEPATLASAAAAGRALSAADREHWQRLVATAAGATWHDVGGGEPLVDDRPVLDELLRESYLADRDPAQLQPCSGSLDPVAAESEAFAAAQRRDWDAVLTAVGRSRVETAYLRQLAGNARWSVRELRSAELEYRRALELADDPSVRDALAQGVARLADELEPIERAGAVAARNAWFQLAIVVAAAAATWALRRS